MLHPTAHHHRCLAMHVFFSIGLLASYRFMFFFIDWKLPPPACPGTTGIYYGILIHRSNTHKHKDRHMRVRTHIQIHELFTSPVYTYHHIYIYTYTTHICASYIYSTCMLILIRDWGHILNKPLEANPFPLQLPDAVGHQNCYFFPQ